MALFTFAIAILASQTQSTVKPPTEPPLDTNPTIMALEKKAGLSFEDLYPRKSYFGKSASGLTWSKSERYLAYLWNPYDDKGNDLWIFDSQTGKSQRVTSIDVMMPFDRKLKDAVERYKKDKADEDKALTLNDLEYREWRLKKKEEDAKRKEPLASYPGIGEIEWNPKADELLFTYNGDVFRWKIGDAKPERLTRTRDRRSQLQYLPTGDGFTYREGNGVYRVKFNSSDIEQLNPDLPDGIEFSGYGISPDGNKLMIYGSKRGPAERNVELISYKDRFAKSRQVGRSVADDDFKGQSYLFLYDISGDKLESLSGDAKPWEVWKWPGGKSWEQNSISETPWSSDSTKFVFATWKRIPKQFEIVVADLTKKELKTIYKSTPDGEHTTPGMAEPMFTREGSSVIALLDASGYRHPWKIEVGSGKATALTSGPYECSPLKLSADGGTLFVTANKDAVYRQNIYGIDLATNKMSRLTPRDGYYGKPTLSDSGKKFTTQFESWTSQRETYVVEDGKETKLTDSHRPGFEKVNIQQPEFLSIKNRHGQDIATDVFLPKGWKKSDKRPMMIYVYGGPLGSGKSVQDGSFNTSAYLFNLYLTKVLGYVTMTIDPHGTSGYGNDFGKANWEQPGKLQVEDLSDAAKYMIENYGVDPKKVAVNGWSFGGFQTQMCMYTAPDVFTLGIAGAGPTEWQNYNNWYSTGVIGPTPNSKPEDLDKYSLTNLAKNLRSPLMLLHGMEDDNVLFQDTVHVYQKLLQYGRGPLVELALDPTGNHGMGGDMDTRDRHAIYLGFIMKWWGSYLRP